MDRLISADALMREVETRISNNKQLIDEWFANVITDAIDDAPTVDAEPVRHGHWIGVSQTNFEKLFLSQRVFKCSVCGNYLDFDGVNVGRGSANYCPNCGAKMNGENR